MICLNLNDEDIEIKVSQFYTKVQSPVLTDISLSIDGIRLLKTNPGLNNLPDIFHGSSLMILGRYRITGSLTNDTVKVTLKGRVKNQERSYSYYVKFPEENKNNDQITRLWAGRRVGYLLDVIRLNGESTEVIDEIVDLSRTYGIVTPYTSYLIVEDEQRRVVMEDLDEAGGISAVMAKGSDFSATCLLWRETMWNL